jgi:hypothetical protein
MVELEFSRFTLSLLNPDKQKKYREYQQTHVQKVAPYIIAVKTIIVVILNLMLVLSHYYPWGSKTDEERR